MKAKRKKPLFLCIDDDAQLAALCEAINQKGVVHLTTEAPPPSWELAIDSITKKLTNNEFDGLLLDFRLDEYPTGPKNTKVRYTAESLVNELRRLSVEGADHSYPIVLWSTAQHLAWYFSINPSYTGLYDGIWEKANALHDTGAHADKLLSLVDGYRRLHSAAQKGLGLHAVLGCDASAVLAEMEQAFTAKIKQAPFAFNYATFIINQILTFNGVLFDLATSAAILGVGDISLVPRIVEKISAAGKAIAYSGVFAGGYERYWRDALLTRLGEIAPGKLWLHLPAKERVDLLAKHLRWKAFEAAKPIHSSYQTDFDCTCVYSGKPLARQDGYRLQPVSQDPWIQPLFVAGTILRKLPASKAKMIRLDMGEDERFQANFGF